MTFFPIRPVHMHFSASMCTFLSTCTSISCQQFSSPSSLSLCYAILAKLQPRINSTISFLCLQPGFLVRLEKTTFLQTWPTAYRFCSISAEPSWVLGTTMLHIPRQHSTPSHLSGYVTSSSPSLSSHPYLSSSSDDLTISQNLLSALPPTKKFIYFHSYTSFFRHYYYPFLQSRDNCITCLLKPTSSRAYSIHLFCFQQLSPRWLLPWAQKQICSLLPGSWCSSPEVILASPFTLPTS